jgi:hypothetical protein
MATKEFHFGTALKLKGSTPTNKNPTVAICYKRREGDRRGR